MGYSIYKAFELLFTLDKEIYFIIFTSLNITFFSTIFASIMSIPLAFIIDISKPRFKKISIAILNSFMALPTVVIGLFVYAFISRSGPLGFMGLLFTPFGIIIGQTILAIPIIASMILAGFSKIDLRLYETLITLGAKKFDLLKAIIFETKTLILSAILGGFGRIIGEVGISMMLGGNIKWYTRTITTAIALETSK
ncbi:MAG: ABC transporter permease, partial [Spirochaetes bacterium GWC1_27_15]